MGAVIVLLEAAAKDPARALRIAEDSIVGWEEVVGEGEEGDDVEGEEEGDTPERHTSRLGMDKKGFQR